MKLSTCAQKVIEKGIVVLLLLTVLQRVHAQYPKVGYSGKLPTDVPTDELVNELRQGKPEQREEALRELGVDSRLAHDTSKVVPEFPMRVENLEGTDASLLFLPCVGPGTPYASIFLMRQKAQLGWRVVDKVSLDCWGTEISSEPVFVPGHEAGMILVHHVNHGHGSGMLQNNMLLLGEQDGHFVTFLDTAEFVSEEILGEEKTIERRSTLQPFPDGSMEETRATTERDVVGRGTQATERTHLTAIERRKWKWDKALQKFTAGGFTAVSAAR